MAPLSDVPDVARQKKEDCIDCCARPHLHLGTTTPHPRLAFANCGRIRL